jgi:hypothetical protein
MRTGAKRNRIVFILICVFAGSLASGGCGRSVSSFSNGSDAGTDSDVDTDVGSDSDTDTDSDTDSDTEEAECESVVSPPSFFEADGDNPGLKSASDCDEVGDMIRQKMLNIMTDTLEYYRQDFLERKAMDASECWYSDSDSDGDGDTDSGGDIDGDADGDADGDSDGAEDYSTTNNQVQGVDEPDFVKNDGSYIYVLADGRFQILDAWPPETANRISATPVEGEPRKMFIYEDKAIVYSSLPWVWTGDAAFDTMGYSECTYGYDCELVGDGRPTKITVFDISDLTEPTVVREIELSGSYLAARRIGGTAYTTAVFPESISFMLSDLGFRYIPEELEPFRWSCGDDIPFSQCKIQNLFDEILLENIEAISGFDPEMVLPHVSDRRLVDGEWIENNEVFEGCESFLLSESAAGLNQISLFAFNPLVQEDLSIVSIIGRPGAVYANAEALYIASRHVPQAGEDWFFDDPAAVPEATTVHKFALTPEAMTSEYRGSGAVKGRVLNQFSMDDHDGYLRIATTTGHLPSSNVHSTVSVLEEKDGSLKVVGQVDDIAPTEDIRSVRFSGDQGYVVTFKKTDPLFILDLADPENPAITGELKIPGFSTYLHLMDSNHLLSIGYDADDIGGFAWFDGLMLQIFDISDPTNPLLDHRVIIGTRGSGSEAATNHLAFNYFPSRDLLAIPVTICEGGDMGYSGYDMTFSGLKVFNVTAEEGFTDLGGLPHAEATAGDDYYSVCGQWWSNATSAVKRSVFMEDYVYSIAPELIRNAKVENLSSPLVSIDLTAP